MRIEGTIVRGRQLGRTLGFPTANLRPERVEGAGADGVYAGWFLLDDQRLPCMLNVGAHPTLPGGGRSYEAHIFDFDGDLYGRRAAVETAAYLRPEARFPSPEALRTQLEADRARCMELLHMENPPGIN